MVVDDHPENLSLIASYLEPEGYRVTTFPSGALALAAAARHPPDLLLLDIRMPEMDGFEVCRRFKNDLGLANIPVVFLSALDEPSEKVKGFQLGCVDYVMKPVHSDELRVRVATHLRMRALSQELQSKNAELQMALEQITEMATRDALTQALNRRAMTKELTQVHQLLQRYESAECLIFIDLDHFKTINDRFGHDAGDRALVAACEALRRLTRDTDVLCRWGGEEFLVLLRHTTLDAGTLVAERMRLALKGCTVHASGQDVTITGSMGVAQVVKGESLKSWIQRADQACYAAKHAGRDRVRIASSR